jgi:uncharacterized protein YbjT (DUF2867 family)
MGTKCQETIMLKPKILVTGATGKTGSLVVAELLKAGYPVRAMVHREDARSGRLKAQGVEIAVADMSDVERVADALKDVQRAYYCPPFDPYMIQGAVAFAIAARESKLDQIVGLTQWLSSPSHPALMTRQLWLVDRLFSMTPGVAHTIVRPGFFADSYLVLTGLAAHLGLLNRPTLSNRLRQFALFLIAPLSPDFNFERYDRELRRPFPSAPQFAPDSKVWRREHEDATRNVAIAAVRKLRSSFQ